MCVCIKYIHMWMWFFFMSCLTNDKKGNRANGFFFIFLNIPEYKKMAIRISNEMLNTSHNQCSTDIYIALRVRTYIAHKIQKTFNVSKQCDEALNRTIAGTTPYCMNIKKTTNSKLRSEHSSQAKYIVCVLCVLDHVLRLLYFDLL